MIIKASPRPLRFLISGGAATGVHWAVMALLVLVGMAPAWATALGAVAGAVTNYPLQHRFTFRARGPHSESISLYLLVCGVGWLANLLLFMTLHQGLNMPTGVAQFLTTAAVAVLNYILYKRWVFHDRSRFSAPGNAD